MGWLRRLLGSFGAIKLDATSRLVRLGRDFYRYEEGGRMMTVQIDMLSGEPDTVIYTTTMTAFHPPGVIGPALTEAERKRLAEKIAGYLRGRGRSVEIE